MKRSQLIKEAEKLGIEPHDLAYQKVRENPSFIIKNDIRERR